jgi:DNA-binding beta-propeller fold protein YncE
VASNGSLVAPGGIAVGPGGTFYIADAGVVTPGGTGAIVAVTPAGTQTVLTTTGATLQMPFDIAYSPDGTIWTAQWGGLSRRGGGFRRTRLSDGSTDAPTGDRSQGIAINDAGVIYLGDCISISLDCYSAYRYVLLFSTGPQSYLPSGAMAVVPSGLTPTRPSTWGSVKTRYR